MKASILGALFFISGSAFAQSEVTTVRICTGTGIRVLQQFVGGVESILVKEEGVPGERYFACRRFDDAKELVFECQGSGEVEDIMLSIDKTDNTASINGNSLTCE